MSKITEELLLSIVPRSVSYAQVLREIGLVPVGGNYKTIKRKCAEWDIDTSHFTGKGWNVGERYRPVRRGRLLEEVMVKDSSFNSSHLAKRLLKENVFERLCSECGRKKWQGVEIPLELDHINGDNSDHRKSNLRFLCPNCHALTPFWRRKK